MLAAAVALCGCAPTVMPAAPEQGRPPQIGPALVVDVVNASAADVGVAYEFESVNAGGGGEGSVPGCERTIVEFGDVDGDYELTIAGTTVLDGQVPPGLPARGYLFVRVVVDAEREVTVDMAPHWRATAPAFGTAPVANCG